MQWQGSIAEREADIRSKNKAGLEGEEGKTEERSKRRYEMGEEEGLYIETAEDEGRRGG